MLFGKKNDIDFFAKLNEAANNTVKAAAAFREAMKGEHPPAAYFSKLKEIENHGDNITHDIFRGLSKVFITPIDREDIMELASKLDDVVDGIEASIARFEYLNVEKTDNYMQLFAEVLVKSCEHIRAAFELLSKKKYLQIHEHTLQINSLENEGDRLMREGIRQIFTHPTDPYHDFKMKELYERLEETTDACEDVADILESIILRYS